MGADSNRAEDVQNRPNSVYKVHSGTWGTLLQIPLLSLHQCGKESTGTALLRTKCLSVGDVDDDKLFMLFSEYIEVYTLNVRVLLSEFCKNSDYLLSCTPPLQVTSSSVCLLLCSP